MSRVGLRELTKTYDRGMVAVDRVNLEIADREFFVLVGPSGCGKTTTLRLVAGLEEPTAGEVYIGDRMVNQVEPRDRDIAMVFQNYALYPHMTVRENMAFALKLRKFRPEEVRRRVEDAARILGLDKLLERKPAALSGGQRQRVALGRAIVRHPRVFLFDEPISNLDARLRVEMRAELARLHRQLETTVLYVTHDQVEAMTLGQRIGVMQDGRLLQVADPMTLYNQPANRFVAGFIGSPPMNFLSGHIAVQPPWGFVHRSFTLDLPPALAGGLAPVRGKPVVLGVRPEGISLGTPGSAPGVAADHVLCPKPELRAQVEVAEHMGNEVVLYLQLGEVSLVARVPPADAPRPGDLVSASFIP
ncbi:sn-glycerol-3-phosphate ABC transporter ATP-binding protein UgpC, partial [candidate division WOR-3 bacterium]|nr:sn-glycerol-3-phosphate ABC transporter ATP-binding protein UgpC [candidate division WOR-3 bacterium]